MPMNKDTILVCPSDLQIGSTRALAPRQWTLIDGQTFFPSPDQKICRAYWEEAITGIAAARKGKRLIVTLDGEAIDGFHHNTSQVITPIEQEQRFMAIDILDEALKEMGFNEKKGDLLYYVEGTDAHEGVRSSNAEVIARDLIGLVPYRADSDQKDGRMTWPLLKININGKKFRIQHHGASVGKRNWTRTNSLKLYLASFFDTCVAHDEEPPDWLIQGHMHRYTRAAHHGTFRGRPKAIEGVILPTMQINSTYILRLAPEDRSDLGVFWMEIDKDGNAVTHDEHIHRAPEDEYQET